DRKKIVLMNDNMRYIIVLDNLNTKDFSQMSEWIHQAIRDVLLHEGIKEEIVERYLHDAGDIIFTKTKDRSHVAKLNSAVRETEMLGHRRDMIGRINEELSMKVSRFLVSDGSGDYIYPHEKMYQKLGVTYGEDLFRTKAAEIKVTLMLEDVQVYRQLIVPLNRTFSQFHEILQTAFNWMDYHLHEFYILDGTKAGRETDWNDPAFTNEGYQPVLNLVSDEEAFNYPGDIEMKLDQGMKLSDFIPDYKQLIYHYDFGDSWRHKIEVFQVIDDYDRNHPVCIDGAGAAPPEDVGGEGGYHEFLRVMNNSGDPEYEHMRRWVVTQRYASFDKEEVNQRLKKR